MSKPEETSAPEEITQTTQHTLEVQGRTLRYTAIASTMHLKGGAKAAEAAIFSVAYILDQPADAPPRPVTFCFNGGPGSSTMWLHMGALGPRRVNLPDAVAPAPPPYTVVDNPEGLLDLSDLVFIDPMGTGFSKVLGEGKLKAYTQVEGDVTSLAEFIERWISRHGRWNAPKFLAGESYGTTRAAGIADHLNERGVAFNGLLLFSVAFDFQTFVHTQNNDLPLILFLPSYTATAAYHQRLAVNTDLPALLKEARAFALGPYASALLQGAALPKVDAHAIAHRLEALTGVEAQIWLDHDLRIDQGRFCALLMADERKIVGRLDSRYLARNPVVGGGPVEVDPSYISLLGPFVGAVNDHLRRTLGWTDETPYEAFSLKVNEDWTVDRPYWAGFLDVSDRMRKAMLANPHMKLYVANGLLDLATPFAGTEYSVAHLGTEPELQAAITAHEYEAGHMMYLHGPSRAQMRTDLVAFYGAVLHPQT
jgi:carboxypeptidase C (cathepsin A)